MILLVLAAQSAVPAPAPTATPMADRKICRAEATTGSIMPAKRICKLKSEWAAIDAASGRSVDNFRNRPQNGLTPGGGVN